MKILFLEPFFGGSHKDFALGFQDHCPHEVVLETLPDRFWKWRMRGAGLYFSNRITDIEQYDLIFATDMLDLTDFIALAGEKLAGEKRPPVWFYFHENQLSYPLSPGEKRDFHLGFTNILSTVAADRVFFNSQYHLTTFLDAAYRLVNKMPDVKPAWVLKSIEQKTSVIYPGCRFDPGPLNLTEPEDEPPLIIWNHRWEHDKNPDAFFQALTRLKKKKIPFSLAVLGENFEKAPAVFDLARQQFEQEIKVFGYVDSKSEYLSWLKKGAIIVSCANQENFGISVVEAVRFGCIPLLPERLSYPEILPSAYHSICLYDEDQDLPNKLESMVKQYKNFSKFRSSLSSSMEPYAWANIIREYPFQSLS